MSVLTVPHFCSRCNFTVMLFNASIGRFGKAVSRFGGCAKVGTLTGHEGVPQHRLSVPSRAFVCRLSPEEEALQLFQPDRVLAGRRALYALPQPADRQQVVLLGGTDHFRAGESAWDIASRLLGLATRREPHPGAAGRVPSPSRSRASLPSGPRAQSPPPERPADSESAHESEPAASGDEASPPQRPAKSESEENIIHRC